jgi:hypothetical protein
MVHLEIPEIPPSPIIGFDATSGRTGHDLPVNRGISYQVRTGFIDGKVCVITPIP